MLSRFGFINTIRYRSFGFLVGGGVVFPISLKLDFFRLSESIYFLQHEKSTFFFQLVLGPIRMFNFSFIK